MNRLIKSNLNLNDLKGELLRYVMVNVNNMAESDGFDLSDELLETIQNAKSSNINLEQLSNQINDAIDAIENLQSSLDNIKFVLQQQNDSISDE